jgi:hypothetical protein
MLHHCQRIIELNLDIPTELILLDTDTANLLANRTAVSLQTSKIKSYPFPPHTGLFMSCQRIA